MSAAAHSAGWDPVRLSVSSARLQPERIQEAGAIAYGSPPPLPAPEESAGAVARTAMEVLLGVRPAGQLNRWLSGPVYVALARRAGLAVRVLGSSRARCVQVHRVSVWQVDENAVEAAVTLHDGIRARAAALRLEVFHGRWLTTALEIG